MAADPTQPKLEFNRDIRPILSEHCFACHGLDSATREADLRLDVRDAAIEMGAIKPGSEVGSELINRIYHTDADLIMPPPESKKELSAEKKELLRRWIVEGAEYQPHWAFIPPQPVTPPVIENQAWVRNPIDQFVGKKLEEKGLTPAPEADLRTLARRVSLDLIGLPPTPEEVDALLADDSPDAYERYVDRLLQSKRWGEHRGRYWLDYARYADTHGIHFDNYREMWAYRDWVIDAFNKNMPFDEFTIEQLAGDLLPDATLDQQIASGFNRCNITTNEGGIIDEEYVVLYARDRTETTSLVWMGLTTGCAVCHDHKFDPISQKEFYELSAFFNNTTQAPRDGNIKDTPPIVPVPERTDRGRWNEIESMLPELRSGQDARRTTAIPEVQEWLKNSDEASKLVWNGVQVEGLQLHLPLDEGIGRSLHAVGQGQLKRVNVGRDGKWSDGYVADKAWQVEPNNLPRIAAAGDWSGDEGFSYATWIRLSNNQTNGAAFARMDDANNFRGWDLWLENGKIGAHIVDQWPDNALKVVSKDRLPGNQWHHVAITYDASKKASGIKVYVNGREVSVDVAQDSMKAESSLKTSVPLTIGSRHNSSPTAGVSLQDLRLYDRVLASTDIAEIQSTTRAGYLVGRLASVNPDKQPAAEIAQLVSWYLDRYDADFAARQQTIAALEKEQQQIQQRGTIAHVYAEKDTSPMAFVLSRGEYDQRRDSVNAATPALLPTFPDDLPRNRLGLARWLLREDQPLTARVTVNRFWQEIFGNGLVKTSGDFGVMGTLPTHPELLDFLAIYFRENQWDIKNLFRLIVTSSTYRQSSQLTPEKLELDRDGSWLSRSPRYRMDAEVIRDYALAVSGLLSPKIGGASVKPYQPEGVWEAVAMIGSNTRDYRRDSGENLYRRSMYTFWKRSAPPASMDIFNAPSREVCTVRRERTNTPLQALVTLNDPQFIEAARKLAEMTLLHGGGEVNDRLQWMAARLVCRPLVDAELKIAAESLNDLLMHYQSNQADAEALLSIGEAPRDTTTDVRELAAWTMLANQMLNLDEALCK